MSKAVRSQAKLNAYKLPVRTFELPVDGNGNPLKISQYFGENVFDLTKSEVLTKSDKAELANIIQKRKELSREMADKFANAVLKWALAKGVTHFTHWFQPLTGTTAEKHDAFLSFENGQPLEKLSASELIQGEPDASSFPHGGSRSTFEARGYTTWDLSSPIFIKLSDNGKTLCIPTAFVSYHGDALDIKTPLLRSVSALSAAATKFVNLTSGTKRDSDKVEFIDVSCGVEQEYFLVDKALYFERPDLVMTGRTLFGASTSRNQQLEDHYFGTIPARVMAFMQEVEVELYRLGVPAKTRHNEVAPGQFEIAPIFRSANIAADNNQLVMATLQSVATKHGFVCLLHEKPFAGINGSGKHVNWSMSDSTGSNLLDPTDSPHTNYRFLAVISIILEAINRHGGSLRAAIASHSNDHRLGANEAPPSIISAFLGDTLTQILDAYVDGKDYASNGKKFLDLRADQLARLAKDNTDRNRTSPFAFTGNKFEFRAVGSSDNIGIPTTILNAAVADVFNDTNAMIEKELAAGKDVKTILLDIIKNYYLNARRVVFNGDGYSQEWQDEAARRGLPNLKTSAEAFRVLQDEKANEFLIKLGVYTQGEINTRFNVKVERYNKHREIEFRCLAQMVLKDILPAAIEYKNLLARSLNEQKEAGISAEVEKELLQRINQTCSELHKETKSLEEHLETFSRLEEIEFTHKIAHELLPQSEKIAKLCNILEDTVPDNIWGLPTYYDMLFIK